jgi:D-alanyl-D-alanine carboxypeptidase (penicillin-binding protein 5/6)
MAKRAHQKRRAHRRRRFGRGLVALLVAVVLVVVAAVAAVVVAATEATPALAETRVLPAQLTFPGAPPALAWPSQGESAAGVDGVGTLGTAGPTTPVPVASLAKVMTAYVVLTDHPLGPGGAGGLDVTVTAADVAAEQADAAQAQSVVAVGAGEQLTEQQLLEGLLLPSGNNAADLLAVADAGSQAAFVAKMNATAKSLGMNATAYTDPSGLTATTTSTAADQLRLAAAAMAIPAFAQVVAMPQATLPVAGVVHNLNTLLGRDGFVGIKTGSDSRAGGCLLFAVQQTVDGQPVRIIGAVLGQDVGTVSTPTLIGAALTASQKLADSVVGALSVEAVLPAGTTVATVRNADGHTVPVTTARSVTRLGVGGMHVPVSVSLAPVGRHVADGQQIGTVQVGDPSPVTPAVAQATMPAVSWSWRLRHVV